VDQKETKEIKLELLVVVVMAMEIFVLLVVKMIGGKNMEQEQLTTQEDYINLE
jgi:ubiquinone biosynthesis protein Coq4